MIQSLKESGVVVMESFPTELKKPAYTSVLKNSVSEILEEVMLYFVSTRAWIENLHTKKTVLKILWL